MWDFPLSAAISFPRKTQDSFFIFSHLCLMVAVNETKKIDYWICKRWTSFQSFTRSQFNSFKHKYFTNDKPSEYERRGWRERGGVFAFYEIKRDFELSGNFIYVHTCRVLIHYQRLPLLYIIIQFYHIRRGVSFHNAKFIIRKSFQVGIVWSFSVVRISEIHGQHRSFCLLNWRGPLHESSELFCKFMLNSDFYLLAFFFTHLEPHFWCNCSMHN